jgi:hypothetical protein
MGQGAARRRKIGRDARRAERIGMEKAGGPAASEGLEPPTPSLGRRRSIL